jgi:hypothetical protein
MCPKTDKGVAVLGWAPRLSLWHRLKCWIVAPPLSGFDLRQFAWEIDVMITGPTSQSPLRTEGAPIAGAWYSVNKHSVK